MERVYCWILLLALAGAALTKPTRQTDGRRTYDPAKPCNGSTVCNLPNCLCASTKTPMGIGTLETPQIITISFTAGLRVEDYENYYSKVFTANRTNPNNCPINVTFFVTHNNTNYALMEDLYYTNGYEIADNTVTSRKPSTWWAHEATVEELTNEIRGQAIIDHEWGNIPQLHGYRAPYLASSENGLQVLHENNFTYDASMPTTQFYWPFTLDYKSPICGPPAVCPQNSYPGLWVIPNIDYYDQFSNESCDVLRSCKGPQNEEEWYEFLMENFNTHYKSQWRPPFGLYAESAWFYTKPGASEALMSFLDKMQTMEDVYIVTHYQLIEWVRKPTPLSKLKSFEPWQCPKRPQPRCSYHNPSCNQNYNDYGVNFQSCTAPCPANWPHYGDPHGN